MTASVTTPLDGPARPMDAPAAMPTWDGTESGRIVVGVDGSSESVHVLRWAARIAAATAARVEVVTTWVPRLAISGPFGATPAATYLSPEDDAQALLTHAIEAAYGNALPPNLTTRVREGSAAHILTEESKTAQLLVVGSLGLGKIAGLLLGSVSTHCAEHAQCSVLIVHEPVQP